MVMSGFERHLHNKVRFTYGACVRVVYSLNSLSCMVKYGLKSLQYFNGEIQLQGKQRINSHVYSAKSQGRNKLIWNLSCFVTFRSNEVALSCNLKRPTWPLVGKPHYPYLTSANTVSEDSDGDGAITTSGSPSSTSSQSIWMWKNTGQKHLKTHGRILIHLTRIKMYLIKNWIKRMFIWKLENTLVKWHI